MAILSTCVSGDVGVTQTGVRHYFFIKAPGQTNPPPVPILIANLVANVTAPGAGSYTVTCLSSTDSVSWSTGSVSATVSTINSTDNQLPNAILSNALVQAVAVAIDGSWTGPLTITFNG